MDGVDAPDGARVEKVGLASLLLGYLLSTEVGTITPLASDRLVLF